MKKSISDKDNNILRSAEEIQAVGDNDILIKNLYAGISHLDAEKAVSMNVKPYFNTISRVVKVGKNIKNIEVGMIVCPNYREIFRDAKYITNPVELPEYILIKNAELDKQIYDVPDCVPLKTACLIAPFAVGFHAARCAAPCKDLNAIVFGADTIGIAAAIGLKYFGCKQVMLCDSSEVHLNIAKAMGFEVCNVKLEKLEEASALCFGSASSYFGETSDVSVFIDTVDPETSWKQYQYIGKKESHMVIIAEHSSSININLNEMARYKHSIKAVADYCTDDIDNVIAAMVSKRWNIELMITDEFPMKSLTEAMERAADSENSMEILVKY